MKRTGIVLLLVRSISAQFSPCDLNQDGVVNVVDVQLTINQALGLSACTLNLDNTGTCDAADVQRIVTAALGGACVSGSEVTNGLVGYWKMDESSGTVAHDSSGYGLNGTTDTAGTFAWQPAGGKIKGCLYNYTSNQPVTIPSNQLINFTGDFTIALWINVPMNDHNVLAWKSTVPIGQGTAGEGYGLGMMSAHAQAFLDNQAWMGTLNIPVNQWVHLAMAKSATTLTLYVNGVADNPISVPAAQTATNSPVILAGHGLDDVRLYNRALSASEIQTVINTNGSYVGASQVPPPTITSFSANPSSIAAGQTASLSWQVSGAQTVSLDNGIGSQTNLSSGSVTVSPAVSTTYTLTATNSGGSDTRTANVIVVPAPAPAPTNVVITAPAANSVLSGKVTLSASITGVPGAVAVEYYLNGRPIYNGDRIGAIANPYSYTWSTFNAWDSYSQLTAAALDSSGNVLSTSAPVAVQIANTSYTLQQTSPNPAQTLTGTITWTVKSNLPASALVACYVDGRSVATGGPASLSFTYDTTNLANGQHEFHCAGAMPNSLPVVMSSYIMNVDNARSLMQVRANFGRLYLAPGDTQNLTARLVYTNGDEAPVTATFSVDNSSVVSVSGSGLVTAVSPGIAHISVVVQGLSTITEAIVNDSTAFPHFSKSGQILTSYNPGTSIFMRSIFLGPYGTEFTDTPALASYFQQEGVNALETGFYPNPADGGNWTAGNYSNQQSLATFKQLFNANMGFSNSIYSIAKANGWSLHLTGDNLARGTNEMIDSTQDPGSAAKIQYALQTMQNTGMAVGISMIDESDGEWGGNPLDAAPGYWAQWSSLFTSSPFPPLLNIMNGVSRPAIAWPTIGIASQQSIANWQGNPAMADYTELYWDAPNFAYPDSASSWDIDGGGNTTFEMMDKVELALPVIQRDKPFFMLIGVTGSWYNLGASEPINSPYNAGVDQLNRPGHRADQIPMQLFMAVARGASGARCYAWDTADKYFPSTLPAGYSRQTGISPYNQNGINGLAPGSRWNALGAGFNLIHTLEPYILQPMSQAVDLGPYIVTGAHSGPSGNMLVAVNVLEMPQTVKVDLSSYANGAAATRYRLLSDKTTSQNLGAVTSDQITLSPSEVVVYVFP